MTNETNHETSDYQGKTFWMFRSTGTERKNPGFCVENNVVTYGWSHLDLKKQGEEALQKIRNDHNARAASMARNFINIEKGDIVVLPSPGAISIGEVIEPKYREEWQDHDAANTYEVKWLVPWYPRKELSSALQGRFKYRGTLLNLWREEDKKELKTLIESVKKGSWREDLSSKEKEMEEKIAKKISEHLNDRSKTHFQDLEFENFIMQLLELHYNLIGQGNSQKKEKEDGKDLTMSIDYDDFNLNIAFNIQVKHHEGNASLDGLHQVNRSDSEAPYVKNVLVTTGNLNPDIKDYAEGKEITLFGPDNIAEMVVNNIEKIEERFLISLGLFNKIAFTE